MGLRSNSMSSAAWKTLLVVITDPFAQAQPALEKAAAVARRSRCSIFLFNSFLIPEPANDAAMGDHANIVAAAIQHRRKKLRQLARDAGVKSAECTVEWGFPTHEVIVRQVLKRKADVLLTDSHRHGRLARWVLTNTDWELMRTCPCPVWLVRSGKLPARPKVLVAVDPRRTGAKPAGLDDRLLSTAIGFTQRFGGDISVVHAYQTPHNIQPGLLRAPIRRMSEELRAYGSCVNDTVTKQCQKYDIDPDRCMVREGLTKDVIADVTQSSRSDILIMGVVSRSMLPRPVIGGTAEAVIDHVACDVLVIKPKGFKTPVRVRRAPAARAWAS